MLNNCYFFVIFQPVFLIFSLNRLNSFMCFYFLIDYRLLFGMR